MGVTSSGREQRAALKSIRKMGNGQDAAKPELCGFLRTSSITATRLIANRSLQMQKAGREARPGSARPEVSAVTMPVGKSHL